MIPVNKGVPGSVSPSPALLDQHRITIAEESILLLDRMRICRHDLIASSQRADQHHQR